jgi:Zinc-binding dehydrogenase
LLGLTASAMARSAGAKQIIVCDPDLGRRNLSLQFGADYATDSDRSTSQIMEICRSANDGRGLDPALEFSGASESVATGLDTLRIGGRYILVGAVFPGPAVALDVQQVVRRMLTIRGLHNYAPRDLATAVAFLSQHGDIFPFANLIAGPFRLEVAEAAFACDRDATASSDGGTMRRSESRCSSFRVLAPLIQSGNAAGHAVFGRHHNGNGMTSHLDSALMPPHTERLEWRPDRTLARHAAPVLGG